MGSWVPPRIVRAFVITPVAFVGSLLVTLLSPLLHLILAGMDLVDRRNWRFTRIVGLGIAFCVVEFFGLVMALLLWVASGFGLFMKSPPIQRLHQIAFRIWLELITRAIETFLGFEFVFPLEDLGTGPLLVLSRHAGPGDALLIARSMMREHGHRIRMLGTTKLLWDPVFNHLVSRMPFYFCSQQQKDLDKDLVAIWHAAATVEDDGVMIIFPEGGNFTPNRHRAAVERLESRGQLDRARRAAAMTHVLPPRTRATLAALDAAPESEVVIVAHVGLDDLLTLDDIWRQIPLNRTVRATYWRGFEDRRPDGAIATIDWLYRQWEMIDLWIRDNSPDSPEVSR